MKHRVMKKTRKGNVLVREFDTHAEATKFIENTSYFIQYIFLNGGEVSQ